jgi:hypothetical protein
MCGMNQMAASAIPLQIATCLQPPVSSAIRPMSLKHAYPVICCRLTSPVCCKWLTILLLALLSGSSRLLAALAQLAKPLLRAVFGLDDTAATASITAGTNKCSTLGVTCVTSVDDHVLHGGCCNNNQHRYLFVERAGKGAGLAATSKHCNNLQAHPKAF